MLEDLVRPERDLWASGIIWGDLGGIWEGFGGDLGDLGGIWEGSGGIW